MRTLYFYQDGETTLSFGVNPPLEEDRRIYDSMSREISLKKDLDWKERTNIQNIIVKADIWDNFPFNNTTLIAAEIVLDEYNQRVDLMYLTNSGGVLLCELKIGGSSKDVVGQLLRYIAEMSTIDMNLDWIRSKVSRFNNVSLNNLEYLSNLHCRKLEKFIRDNDIQNVNLDWYHGVFIDENPDKRALLALKFLNDNSDFSFQAYSIQMLTTEDWHKDKEVQYIKMNIEFVNLESIAI